MKEAYLYKKLDDKKVRCDLCNHRCLIKDQNKGKCCVMKNIGGTLYSLVYGKLIAENSDPIEKKPLFHFLPGTSIFFEYAYDTAKLASEKGLKNVFVTNGFMTKECIMMMEPYLDAANVDLKSFSEETYKRKMGGRLKPVLNNIILMKKLGIWVEVTTLIIPGINDSKSELQEITKFLAAIDKGIPWHISAYYPQYKSDIPPTSVEQIKIAIDIGKSAGLKYVYGGNIPGSSYENTYCPKCNSILIERFGFSVSNNKVKHNSCSNCGQKIDGIFQED